MPIHGQIVREGELLPLRWGWWHIQCMTDAVESEGADLWKKGTHTLRGNHTYTDPADGEVLPLVKGDTLRLFR